jgi:hypothetical protein
VSTPNRNGDIFEYVGGLQEYEGAFFKGLSIPRLDLSDLPAPFRFIRRINLRPDGFFEAVDGGGERIALLPIESVAVLHTEYGVTLGTKAWFKLQVFLKPKEAGLKSLASELAGKIGVLGPWTVENEPQKLSDIQVETLSSKSYGKEVKFSPGSL